MSAIVPATFPVAAHAARSPSSRAKGSALRAQRDQQILEFARRQRQIREAVQTARPSMRDYYKDEELRRAKQKSANYTSFCRADRAHPACDCEITEEREWRERKASWFLYGIVCWR